MDKRDESKFHELSQKALKKINIIISQENNAYSKFYLNKGRILLLMGKYSSGEEYINKAIKSINVSPDRDRIAREYEQYLVKSSNFNLAVSAVILACISLREFSKI